MHSLFGLVGAGGLGRTAMPLARKAITDGRELCFVERDARSDAINGHRVIAQAEFLDAGCDRSFNVAISDSRLREALALRFLAAGCTPQAILAETTTILDDNSIGEGGIFCGYTTVTSNTRIGRFFHANLYSYVEHDCVIGDFVTFAPGVQCNGNVVIEDHAYIGAGAILRDGRPGNPLVIGTGAVVGMGAVVTRSVAAGTVVVGNPAGPIRRRLQ